jgi:hypothetical protein
MSIVSSLKPVFCDHLGGPHLRAMTVVFVVAMVGKQ